MSRLSLSAALAFLLVLTACVPDAPGPSSSESVAPTPSSTEAPEASVTVVWETEESPIGDPWVSDDVVVSYIRTDTGMALAGFDPATGERTWRHPANPGSIPSGMSIDVVVLEHAEKNWAALLSDVGEGWSRVVVVNAATGGIRGLGEHRIRATSLPSECIDDEVPAFCLQGEFTEGDPYERVRVDVDASTIAPIGNGPQPTNSRMLGHRVYSTNERSPEGTELLGYIGDGKVLWEHDYHDLFGPDTSSDAGWQWFSGDNLDPVIGQGHVPVGKEGDNSFTLSLLDSAVAAVSRDSGKISWRAPKTDFCDFSVYNYFKDAERFVGCRYSSGEIQVDWHKDGSVSQDHKDVSMSLVGLDLFDGTLVWEHTIDPELLYAPGQDWGFTASATELVVPATTTSVDLIDPQTGTRKAAEPDDVFVCERERERFLLTWKTNSPSYSPGTGFYPCDQSGAELPEWTASRVEQASRRVGDVHVISMPDRLIGVRVE